MYAKSEPHRVLTGCPSVVGRALEGKMSQNQGLNISLSPPGCVERALAGELSLNPTDWTTNNIKDTGRKKNIEN